MTDTARGAAPLSFAQQRLWLLDQLEPAGRSAYNLRAAYRITGSLDARTLERSLSEIIRRHETLRTTIAVLDGRPRQIVQASSGFDLPVVSFASGTEWERGLQPLMAIEAERPFDLFRGPLVRATLFRRAPDEHVLLLVMHHIISDGWSMGVLLGELLALYEAFAHGQPSPLEPLPIQYREHARRQHEARRDEWGAHVSYWRRQLAGIPAASSPPADPPRPPEQTFRGAHQSRKLPRELSSAIETRARETHATPFMILLAAFGVLLHRYTGDEDLVIGSPVANRNRMELERLIGFFVNTLPLRVDLSGRPTFRELVRRVRRTALEAYDHADVPFEILVEELQPERNPGLTPVFQVMLIFQNPPMPVLARAGLTFTYLDVDSGTAKVDFSLFARPEPGGLVLVADYNRDLFEPATAERLLEHLEQLLAGAVANPDARVGDLPLLTPDERHRLLVEWNRTEAPYPAESCIHTLFEAQVARTPSALAVADDRDRLTFEGLNARANRLAHFLGRHGVGRGSVVAVYLPRGAEAAVALLAALKAGAAYLPLDDGYPAARIGFMLADARPCALLTTRALSSTLPEGAFHTICLEEAQDDLSVEPAIDPGVHTTPDDAAYLLYTSGSTGRPKGVVGLHRGAVNRFAWMWRAYPFVPSEVCCQKTPLGFVDSVWELFGPLLQGIPIAIVADEVVRDPDRLLATLAAHRITRIVLVPSLLRLLLGAGVDLAARVPDLRLWVSSGEPLPVDVWKTFRARLPEATLLNLYGSSEVSADATAFDTRAMDDGSAAVPIGRPIANTSIYILDANLNPVPIGVPGEICVGGTGLARGYVSRPELTAQRFVANPFVEDPRARLFRTGDRARYRADGQIEILGRADSQVKIRGARVELTEIEATLDRHPSVRESAVVAREVEPGDWRLAAFVVPSDGGPPPSAQELRLFARSELPGFMVPSTFVMLDALPLTPHGKVDRRRLVAAEPAAPPAGEEAGAPRSPMEKIIVELWSEALETGHVSLDDTFYDQGGHSLLAALVLQKLKARTGIALHPRELLVQSLRQIAAHCDEQLRVAAKPSTASGPLDLPLEVK